MVKSVTVVGLTDVAMIHAVMQAHASSGQVQYAMIVTMHAVAAANSLQPIQCVDRVRENVILKRCALVAALLVHPTRLLQMALNAEIAQVGLSVLPVSVPAEICSA